MEKEKEVKKKIYKVLYRAYDKNSMLQKLPPPVEGYVKTNSMDNIKQVLEKHLNKVVLIKSVDICYSDTNAKIQGIIE